MAPQGVFIQYAALSCLRNFEQFSSDLPMVAQKVSRVDGTYHLASFFSMRLRGSITWGAITGEQTPAHDGERLVLDTREEPISQVHARGPRLSICCNIISASFAVRKRLHLDARPSQRQAHSLKLFRTEWGPVVPSAASVD